MWLLERVRRLGTTPYCRAAARWRADVLESIGRLRAAAHTGESGLTVGQRERLAVARSRQLVVQELAVTATRDRPVASDQLPAAHLPIVCRTFKALVTVGGHIPAKGLLVPQEGVWLG